MRQNISLKSVYQILEYSFFIPSYQRGYRWDDQQVLDLLNDIYEFAKNKDVNKGFYCLQPIVVKFDDENTQYRVIDGQQRLTTIYIILKYLEDARNIIFSDTKLFNLNYETRDNSKQFLQNELSNGINKKNPDFYYMSKAYETIKHWFKNNKINKGDFLNVLLKYEPDENGNDLANNIRFIWYEVEKNENEIDVFTRLNIGKIPLRNSELIKAIILHNLKEYEKFEIVAEWDYIEKNLQNERFFSFLTKENYKNTKIDFIFNLLAYKYRKEKEYKLSYDNSSKRFSFYVFNHLVKEKQKERKEIWKDVKVYFRIFEEFYNDNTYYHYIGFIINGLSQNINDLINIYKCSQKNEFKVNLENMMKIELDNDLEKLEYDSDSKKIEKLLFLFNVLITMQSGYSRYPFDIHKKEKWSLEHIHAQNSEEIKDKKKLLQLQAKSNYISKEIKAKINALLDENEINIDKFIEIQQEIYREFTDEKEEIHSIDNLALLAKDDNSSLGNSIFPEKRAKIKALDKNGRFIPLGTKNVFMKYYSDEVDEFLTWNKEDRKSYLKVLKEILMPFIAL